MRFIFITLSVLLCSCAAQGVNPILPEKVKIGIIYPELSSCINHTYTGVTVFQNKKESYKSDFNWKKETLAAFKKTAAINGHEIKEINEASLIKPLGEFYETSSWDGSLIKLKDKSIENKLKNIVKKNNINLLVFSGGYGGLHKKAKGCSYIFVRTNQIQKDGVVSAGDYYAVVDANTLLEVKISNRSGGTDGLFKKSELENAENFTDKDIGFINALAAKDIESSVRLVFKSLGIGERNYSPGTIKYNGYLHYVDYPLFSK